MTESAHHDDDPNSDKKVFDAEILPFPTAEVEQVVIDGEIVDEPLSPPVVFRQRPDMVTELKASGEMLLHRVTETAKRPDLIAAAVLRHQLYFGLIGTAKGTGVFWRWINARELDAQLGTNAKMVLDVRQSRKKVALGTAVTATATGAAAWTLSPLLPFLAVMVLLAVAGTAERKQRAKGTADSGRDALGTHPGSKAVRRALAAAKLGKTDKDIRVIGAVTRDGDAWVATIELPPGTTYKTATKKRGEIASAIGVDEVQVALDPVKGHNGRVKVWVADEDPMQGGRVENPLVSRVGPVDFWTDKVFAGRDARGREVGFALPERSYLLGGEPGGGKSVAGNNILTFAAMDPYVDIYLADGKYGFDLMLYEGLAKEFIGDRQGHDPVMEMLEAVRDEMNRRYKLLRKLGVPKITREIAVKYGINPILVHLDEIQAWSASGDTKADKAFVLLVADIVGRGRAACIVVGAITQRPAAEVVPTRLRDILSIRWALRCTTPDASDTILGSGRAGQGYSASTFNADQRGAGYLLSEGAMPIQTRAAFLNDTELQGLTQRAHDLRKAAGTLPDTAERPGVKLLLAVLEAMGGHPKGAHTADVLEALTRMDGFTKWDPTKLAAALKPLGVFPRQVDIDGRNRNGYRREDIVTAIDRA